MAQEKILGNQLNLTDVAQGLPTEVVNDTTPQLGGDLDVQTFNIQTGTGNAYLDLFDAFSTFQSTGSIFINSESVSLSKITGTSNVLIEDTITATAHVGLALRAGQAAVDGTVSVTNMHSSNPALLAINDANNSNSITLTVPAVVATNRTWVLPADDPTTAAGQFLTTDASGNLSFAAAGGGGVANPLTADLDTGGFTIGDADDDTKISFGSADSDTLEIFAGNNGYTAFTSTSPIISSTVAGYKGGSNHVLTIEAFSLASANSGGGGSILIKSGDGLTGTSDSGDIELECGDTTNRIGNQILLSGTRDSSTAGITLNASAPSGGYETSGSRITLTAGLSNGAFPAGDILLQPGRAVDSGGSPHGIDGSVYVQSVSMSTPPALMFRTSTTGNACGFSSRTSTVANNQVWRIPDDGETGDDNLGIDMGEFTVAGLPTAANYKNCWALVTDAAGGSPIVGRVVVRSDGTNWKYVAPEGVTVT